MNIPAIQGIIRRRILLNYRVVPEVMARILPDNFRPKVVEGYAIAGVCLIRLEEVRPKGFPAFTGVSSENTAHRIAVEWNDEAGRTQEGVFIPRRDTDSFFTSLVGGKLFPGVHHHSRFRIEDENGQISIRIEAGDMVSPLVELDAMESEGFPGSSLFDSLAESSRFFENGCIGYSSRPDSCVMDGLRLKVSEWRVSPLSVQWVKSAFYDDTSLFPDGSIAFDHALLMRDIMHEWHSEPPLKSGN